MSEPDTARAEATSGQPGVPGRVLALLGALLVCILAVGGFTLYLVSELEDQSTQAGATPKTVKETKAVLDLVVARQFKNEDVPAKVEQAASPAMFYRALRPSSPPVGLHSPRPLTADASSSPPTGST